MDEDDILSVDDDIDIDNRADSPQESSKRLSSGLTLVLPPLKSLQQAKIGKKSKSKAFHSADVLLKPKRPPRPAKLKPLKEVLTKLIANIKKKDDYGFFLVPVDVKQVPGYSDVVQTPMDFGTISNKVAKGRYASLDAFMNDVRLVTSNAKNFNPPGTIYHTEAEKIEAWALEHIEKASSTVLQYETNWDLDPEKEDSGDVNIEDEIGPSTDMGTPGPSELPSDLQSSYRRSTRGPYKKSTTTSTPQKGISESIDSEGRLPGSKDGIGAFPPGSELAKTMLDLKLKGKRYKTKKERMRIEKEGPPFRSDGSLDYYQIEDPFLLFTDLVPTTLTRPLLTPIYPPLSINQTQRNPAQTQTPQPSTSFPIPTTVPLNRHPHQPALPKGRHWVVTRNVNYRRGKDREDENDDSQNTDWKAAREAHATDFGSLALLAGELAEEMKRRGISGDDEQRTMEIIKDSLDCVAPQTSSSSLNATPSTSDQSSYWSSARAAEAEDHIRDVVYGGVEGFAYVRSLAEFVTPSKESLAVDENTLLEMSLATWVERNVVDPMTGYQHSILRDSACQILHELQDRKSSDSISSQISRSLNIYPQVHQVLQLLLQLRTQAIDMGSLIRVPDEIYRSETEWFGNTLSSTGMVKKEDPMEVDAQGSNVATKPNGISSMEQLDRVFAYVANAIVSYDKRKREQVASQMKVDEVSNPTVPEEDPVLRNIRLNLLALAKRAPLDRLAYLHRDLVPEQIRHAIPILTTTPVTPIPPNSMIT